MYLEHRFGNSVDSILEGQYHRSTSELQEESGNDVVRQKPIRNGVYSHLAISLDVCLSTRNFMLSTCLDFGCTDIAP